MLGVSQWRFSTASTWPWHCVRIPAQDEKASARAYGCVPCSGRRVGVASSLAFEAPAFEAPVLRERTMCPLIGAYTATCYTCGGKRCALVGDEREASGNGVSSWTRQWGSRIQAVKTNRGRWVQSLSFLVPAQLSDAKSHRAPALRAIILACPTNTRKKIHAHAKRIHTFPFFTERTYPGQRMRSACRAARHPLQLLRPEKDKGSDVVSSSPSWELADGEKGRAVHMRLQPFAPRGSGSSLTYEHRWGFCPADRAGHRRAAGG